MKCNTKLFLKAKNGEMWPTRKRCGSTRHLIVRCDIGLTLAHDSVKEKVFKIRISSGGSLLVYKSLFWFVKSGLISARDPSYIALRAVFE